MFIKKYLLFCVLPLLLSGETIVGKWEIDAIKTEQSIDKLSIDDNGKKLLMFMSLAGLKSIECFEDKTCIQNSLTVIDSCMGHFHWKKNNNNYYTLTPYTDKLCPDITSKNKKTKITINHTKLNFIMKNESESFSFIYSKIQSIPSKQSLNPLTNIQYNKIYKSKAVDTYSASTALSTTYFYLVFTDKTNFYSLSTTQSNISSINEMKNIIQKKSEKLKESENESAREQLERLKNMPYSSDKNLNAIQVFSIRNGKFTPNKHGIRSDFNSYHKESDIKYTNDEGGFGIEWEVARKCEQITFMPNNTLNCDNGIQYTLLNKSPVIENASIKNKIQKNTNTPIVNIDSEAVKRREKEKLEKEFQDAIKDVM